jgi:glycosyltransferase involved in cell wall biosynthesis
MKIITLVPIKNEAWILAFSLKNFSIFSDEIILLDDSSTDDSVGIAQLFPKVKILPYKEQEKHVNMSTRRKKLLEAGRSSGGTHFIFLDADEILSDALVRNVKELLEKMTPGEKLLLSWIMVYKENNALWYSPEDRINYKDFIFYDDHISSYGDKALSEARTPEGSKHNTVIPFEKGYVFHLQHISSKRYELKQAWYRCQELLEGKRSAKRINATYDFTKRDIPSHLVQIKDAFVENNIPLLAANEGELYRDQIENLFSIKGILFFEPIDIWHIPELKEIFIQATGRVPKPSLFPTWLIILNKFKNKVRNAILR